MDFNDRRANRRALKKAQGKSLAPKGYHFDAAGREAVHYTASKLKMKPEATRKNRYDMASYIHGDVCYICGQEH